MWLCVVLSNCAGSRFIIHYSVCVSVVLLFSIVVCVLRDDVVSVCVCFACVVYMIICVLRCGRHC